MVSPAVRSLPWPLVVNPAPLPLAPAADPSTDSEGGAIIPVATLKQTVCRMAPLVAQRFSFGADQPRQSGAVAAVRQLMELVIGLRSPTGGWPATIPQTPENLAPYVSEEVEVLLDALAHSPAAPYPTDTLWTILDLVPTLLWLIASSSYESMHLLEGVRARVYATDAQFTLRIIRLVPVLELTTESGQAAIDLVTLEAPATHLYLSGHTTLRLLDNDLDNQPLAVSQFRRQLTQVMGQTQPELTAWLGAGSGVTALIPGQPWQPATVQLRLHLADMGPREAKALLAAMTAVTPPAAGGIDPQGRAAAEGPTARFTLDDFADTLPDSGTPTPEVLGDWLTFTDETWVHDFLVCYGQQILGQQVSGLSQGPAVEATQHSLTWVQRAYGAASVVVGPNGLFKQTFVHEPALVADVWPRLRWHMAQTSARLMQWMGGLSVQALTPGSGWQRCSLQLRSLMSLTTDSHRWVIDLSSGKLLPARPKALEPDTVVRLIAGPGQQGPVTIADLMALISQDLHDYAPALAALSQGTPIHLHRMETAEGCQTGRLTLDWYFTFH